MSSPSPVVVVVRVGALLGCLVVYRSLLSSPRSCAGVEWESRWAGTPGQRVVAVVVGEWVLDVV